eukprot:6367840-Alexandrium_andersonii.AAC.1
MGDGGSQSEEDGEVPDAYTAYRAHEQPGINRTWTVAEFIDGTDRLDKVAIFDTACSRTVMGRRRWGVYEKFLDDNGG